MSTAELVHNPTRGSASALVDSPAAALDVAQVRKNFPILARPVHGHLLVYLDNAATTQKPQAVLDALTDFYQSYNANVHRGVHQLSQEATDALEVSRRTVQQFIGAREESEVIFTSGVTEAINLVAQTYGRTHLQPGDDVIVSEMEHHANIVPWQMVCRERGANLKVIPIDEDGDLRIDEFERLLSDRTKIVAVTHISNVLGTVNPVEDIVRLGHQHGAVVLIDGAQSAAHTSIDVAQLGCDFFTTSGHKTYGPTGIGALYGRAELLHSMPPYQTGGDMIETVRFEDTTFADIPNRFEAGTPNIAGAIGMAAAIEYVSSLDQPAMRAYEGELLQYAREQLESVPGVRLIGSPQHQSAVVSFTLSRVHPHDIGTILDRSGVAIRTGQHCAQPLMERLGVPSTSRISLAMYNTREEIDAAVEAIYQVKEMFRC